MIAQLEPAELAAKFSALGKELASEPRYRDAAAVLYTLASALFIGPEAVAVIARAAVDAHAATMAPETEAP